MKRPEAPVSLFFSQTKIGGNGWKEEGKKPNSVGECSLSPLWKRWGCSNRGKRKRKEEEEEEETTDGIGGGGR